MTTDEDAVKLKEAEARADAAEGKLAHIKRMVWGILFILMDSDEIMARLMKRAERKGEQIEM